MCEALKPEVARHHQLRNRPSSEFESLPPSHFPRDRRRFLMKSARVTHLSVRVESLTLAIANRFAEFNFGSSCSATVSM